ncbi:MAG: putative transport system permease protein [Solirubrobacteraceae bacterium]|nr:putative transport system permease protein [Solirubrobacteraceae bacterium]
MRSFVWRELVRNPRRTLASLAGIVLGVGLFSAVLFFVDGSGATMTQRAIAPLALDMQRLLSSPLGGDLRLTQRVSARGRSLRRGQRATVTLTVLNSSAVPANELVVQDEPAAALAYVHGSMRRDGARLPDVGAASPLAQGVAGSGLNIGTLGPGSKVTFTYRVRARWALRDVAALRPQGRVSTRENVVPVQANAPANLTAQDLSARIARIPAVVAADALSFADLPEGALKAGGARIADPVRVFAFDERYQRRYPSIRLASGGFGSALLSAEAARTLGAGPGSTVQLSVPGRAQPLSLPVSGVTDLARAKPLFYSRKTSKLEDFIYVPDSIVVSPEIFRREILPAFQLANARRGSSLKSLPVSEVDVLIDRSRLHTDPGRALAQSEAVARSVSRVAPGQDTLIDNISNTLQVARDDAAVGRRMFLFLGLPGVLLAAFLAAYSGSILAGAQRRDQANLRIRGAHRGHLARMLAYRTLALAGAGSLLGVALGFASALAILGPSTLLEAATADLALSALIAIAVGMVTTALALYIPGRRSLRREISQERRELRATAAPAWRMEALVFAGLAVAFVLALRARTFDPPAASVSEGQAVTLPPRLLLAPLVAWFAGVLLAARAAIAVSSRLPLPAGPRFGSPVWGTLCRSLRRRSRSLATGIAGVGLVVAFGTAIALFGATYDGAKAADSTFVVGSDLRVKPSVLSPRPHPPSYASKLEVPGVVAATPVVAKLENSVLVGPFDQNRQDLTAIDPASFERVAALRDAFVEGGSASTAMHALRAHPRGLLVNAETADDLSVEVGDRVKVLLARGTKQQTLKPFEVVGLFNAFPGFPAGTNLVANLEYYVAATGVSKVDYFLARARDPSDAGLARAAAELRSGPGKTDPINIDSRTTALDKDQSSLAALNIQGLVDLDSLFTLLMSAAVIAIFVFGLMLERRREYVTMRAQGMLGGELRALVLGEAGVVALCGVAAGLLVGTGMAALLVHVLRGLFILPPGLVLPALDVAVLAGLAAAATLVSALVATAMLRRLRPTELLREG